MDRNTPTEGKNKIASFRLKFIDVFFAAYGTFISGLFCIAQYFWGSLEIFIWIASGFFFATLLVTYILSCSKKTSKNEHFVKYVQECANKVGVLNPIMLAVGFLLSITSDIYILGLCILLEFTQLCLYIISIPQVFHRVRFAFFEKAWLMAKSNTALLITTVFAILSCVGWICTADEIKIPDLFLNLLAGFISSIITIGVIDRIIKKQQAIKDSPIKKVLYRDVQLFTSRLINLWQEMYIQSTEKRSEITIEELFDPQNIVEIGGNLDLEGLPNIIPEQNWFVYIENQRKDLVELGDKILSTYVNIAEPELFQALHYLVNDSAYLGFLRWINVTRKHDVNNNIPRPTLFGWYTLIPQITDYAVVKQLFSWCRSQHKFLSKQDAQQVVGIYPITERVALINPNMAPTSIMPSEKKVEAYNAYKQWKDSHTQGANPNES